MAGTLNSVAAFSMAVASLDASNGAKSRLLGSEEERAIAREGAMQSKHDAARTN
jgi:hypothetical protein